MLAQIGDESPEFQESIVAAEVTVSPAIKTDVAAIITKDVSEVLAASLRYKKDIQGDLPSLPDGLWLMDTGCGVDLVNYAGAGNLKVETVSPQDFQTAGGRVTSEHVVPMHNSHYQESIRPYLLPETPWVLSVGKRCQAQGFCFFWGPFSDTPIIYSPMGQRTDLISINYVPYLQVGQSPHTVAAPSINTPTLVVPAATVVEPSKSQGAGDQLPAAAFPRLKQPRESSSADGAQNPGGQPAPPLQDDGVGRLKMPKEEDEEGDGASLLDLEPPEPVPAPVKQEKEEESKMEMEQENCGRDLKAEAKSLKHLLTHLPKNPHCQACQEAKMKQIYSRRGAFQRPLERFGHIITFDHMFSAQARMIGLDGEMHAFNMKDLYTGFIAAFPVRTRDAESCIAAIRQFMGGHKVHNIYSDNAHEFFASAERLGVPHETSVPGVHKTNAIIERTNQIIKGGTTACLLQAGFPPCFWSVACKCFCTNYNFQGPTVTAPWETFHGVKFEIGRAHV